MTQINPNNTLQLNVEGDHKKIGSGEASLLLAMVGFQNVCDKMQVSLAHLNEEMAKNEIPSIVAESKKQLADELKAMDEMAQMYKKNPNAFKDKNGTDLFGNLMMAREEAYVNLKKSNQNRIDQATQKTTMLSNTVQDINKSSSFATTNMQVALEGSSAILDILASLKA